MDTKKRLVELSQGVLVEGDVLRIAEKIQEYDENLYLQYSDPRVSNVHDAPYRLIEHCKDGIDRVVFYIWELNEKVLERIYAADSRKVDVLANIEKVNKEAEKEMVRRYQDKMEADADMVRHILASPKSEYTIPTDDGGIARVSDLRPVERIKEQTDG